MSYSGMIHPDDVEELRIPGSTTTIASEDKVEAK